MESTDIQTEAKVYESMCSEGNKSRSGDHLQDFYFPYIHLYVEWFNVRRKG